MITFNTRFEIILALVLSSVVFINCGNVKSRNPRIAIIGAGIGGSVTAYELSKLTAKRGQNISLDVYEAALIGGRLAIARIDGNEYEFGGSIIHTSNRLMKRYVESSGLDWNIAPDDYDKKIVVGFYDGKEFIYVSSNNSAWDVLRLWWRYGFDIITLDAGFISPMLSRFERIYEALEKGKRFDDVHSLLAYMDKRFVDLMKIEFDQYVRSKGFGERFIKELAFMATNINYNQNIDIPAFVGSVAMAGAQEHSSLSVVGGNKLVPEMLLSNSDARIIISKIESIFLTPDSKYAMSMDDTSYIYDFVVIACPLIENSKNKIKFEGFSDLNIPLIKYQKTIATLVRGQLNHTFFHYDSPYGLPNHIFSVNEELFYSSITLLFPVIFNSQYDRNVFKVFSKDVLTYEQLNLLFLNYESVHSFPWLAYPLYDTEDRNLSFVLHNNLFYLNTIEWAASAMEMSAISGFNVALHINDLIQNLN